ncbi:MAG: FkbM family methyltransferase [Nitrospirales bacterium]
MAFLKKLAWHLVPSPILVWAKKQYYAYVVPRFFEAEVEPIKCFIRPGDSVIDLGANIGWYTTVLSRLVGERGKVYAVEPIPGTFMLLLSVIKKLGLINVVPFNCAVSDSDGFAVMEVPKHEYGGENYYMASIVSGKPPEQSSAKFEVPLRTLDSLLPGQLSEGVSFVKCDVEGHELAVLKGASQFFQRVKPAMMIEVSGTAEMQDAPNNEFYSIMKGYGYTAYSFDGKHLRRRMKGQWSVNYFFLRVNHLPQVAHLIVE